MGTYHLERYRNVKRILGAALEELDPPMVTLPTYTGNLTHYGAYELWDNSTGKRARLYATCLACHGRGWVENPSARYERDRDTGTYETNDPEEVDCEVCRATGLVEIVEEPEARPASLPEEDPF